MANCTTIQKEIGRKGEGMGTKHTTVKIDYQSPYLQQIDPVTRSSFSIGENVVICLSNREPIKVSSLVEIGNECPYCSEFLERIPHIGETLIGDKKNDEISSPKKGGIKVGELPQYRVRSSTKSYWLIGLGVGVIAFLLFTSSFLVIKFLLSNKTIPTPPISIIDTQNPTDIINSTSEAPEESPSTQKELDTWVAFSFGKDQINNPNFGRDLFIMNIFTEEVIQLTYGNNGNNFPSFSPDRKQVVFSSCRPDCSLYILNLETNIEAKVTTSSKKEMWPNWCQQTNKPWIVFEERNNNNTSILMIDLSTGKITPLTDGTADGRPIWSPDCNEVLFGRAKIDTNKDGLVTTNDMLDPYLYNIDNNSTYSLFETESSDEFGFAWDYTKPIIAFTQVSQDTDNNGVVNLNDQSDLFIYNLEDGQTSNITKSKYSAFTPSFSSDGDLLLFTAYYGNQNKIVAYSFSETRFIEITNADYYYHAKLLK